MGPTRRSPTLYRFASNHPLDFACAAAEHSQDDDDDYDLKKSNESIWKSNCRQPVKVIDAEHPEWVSGQVEYLAEVPRTLSEMRQDGLVRVSGDGVRVTEAGRPFVRNVCMVIFVRADN